MERLKRFTVWAARYLDYLVLGYLAVATLVAYVRPPQDPTVGGWALLLLSLGLLVPAIFITQIFGYASRLRGLLTLIPASGLTIMLFAKIYQSFGIINAKGITIIPKLDTAIYFSIVTWTTLGYGDFSPDDDIRLIAATEAILGYLVMALIIGFAVAAIRELNR